ncbi:MAG TPA: aminoglycoside adenylyltransferase domain-containing protein [Gemmatimonadaceae bacterium]|nr:aminoglycoside adenylyltransferase domain-containing protein [Gemmatimonadaceae bacterium]
MPAPLARTLRNLTTGLRETLGANLVGAYLYGSLTQGAFDPARSDIDCIVVVRRDLTETRFGALSAWLARAAESDAWIGRLQMQVLIRSRLLRSDTRGALYQFGVLRRSGSDGNPIVWQNVLATGRTLLGPPPNTLLPRITKRMVFDALVREVAYLRAEIGDPASEWRRRRCYRAYAVLTLCRILYTHRTGDVASKPRASTWALRTLPVRWHTLIRAALASDRGETCRLPATRIAAFIGFVESQLAVAAASPSAALPQASDSERFPIP